MTSKSKPAWLALEDGTIFQGLSVGAEGETFGELVFNTGMTGYQEVLTDPSYCGQIVVMTYPEIGIYGINPDDVESDRLQVAGFVMHRAVQVPSNHRATLSVPEYLAHAGIVGIEGVDTRALTRHLRTHGAMRGAIVSAVPGAAVRGAAVSDGTADAGSCPEDLVARVGQSPSMVGRDLARNVSAPTVTRHQAVEIMPGTPHVIVIDAGRKEGIVRDLVHAGAAVTVVPYDASFESLMALKPDGVLVSNGPGDPEPLVATVSLIRDLLRARVPLAGICLGHQLLGLAAGGQTYKMRFGHRGANHPVKVMEDGCVVITTQNHGFAVDPTSLGIGWAPLDAAFRAVRPELCGDAAVSGAAVRGAAVPGAAVRGAAAVTMAERLPAERLLGESPAGFGPIEVTHLSLNDGTIEGLRLRDYPAFSVQFHPEAAPGPHDAKGFFAQFMAAITSTMHIRETYA